MIGARLPLVLDAGFEAAGRVGVFHPPLDADLRSLDHFEVISPHAEAPATWPMAQPKPSGRYDTAIVCLPRAKDAAHALIAQALSVTDGPVLVDGQKLDGIDSLLRAVRARVPISGLIAKAHGKAFWFGPTDAFRDWQQKATRTPDGFWTAPGLFSADGVDKGSALLAEVLPERLGAHVVDLGAGWGALSARVLERAAVEICHLVEVDHAALACAKQNVLDLRARFHWADARSWHPPALVDAVVMNPPFHTGRAAEPGLGQAFIAAAARMLKPQACLWMVANRQLPYEETLRTHFAEWREIGGDTRFKISIAARPIPPKRHYRIKR